MFEGRKSLLKTIAEKIHPKPLPQKISECIFSLKVQQRKIERTSYHMQERDQSLYGKCVLAIRGRNTELAGIYADECEQLRKIAEAVIFGETAVQQAILRLEDLIDSDSVYSAGIMMSVARVLREVMRGLEDAMPEISMDLFEVVKTLEKAAHPRMRMQTQIGDITSPPNETTELLKTAEEVTAGKMKKRFPKLPEVPRNESAEDCRNS